MSLLRIRDPDALRPLHVVLICIVAGTLLGGYLFLSAAESQALIDGAVEWRVDSPLRAIVQVLCLHYQFPTIHAGAFKVFILGLGSGLAVIALSVAFAVGSRDNEHDAPALEVDSEAQDVPAADVEGKRFSRRGLKTHRQKVVLSASDYGKLVGVTGQTVYNWENGKSKPRDEQFAALVGVRAFGKREAWKRLELLQR